MDDILNFLFELRGSYSTSFYSIYLNGTYKEDITSMTQRDQGTLLHEYIHFVQNVSTPFGLYQSMVIYNCMCQVLHEMMKSNDIQIPVKVPLSETLNNSMKKLMVALGTKGLKNGNGRIDWNIPCELNISDIYVKTQLFEVPVLTVTLDTGKTENIAIGATIVMETMSALYQSLIDPKAMHPDVPYNAIVYFCRQYYPKLATDTRKLICLCYASLFSLAPGAQLISLIKQHGNDDLDGYQVFLQFIQSYTIKDKDGNEIDMVKFVDDMIGKFKNMLSGILASELDYLQAIFEPLKLSSQWIPVVTALYDKKPFSINHFKTMIDQIGMPYLHTSTGQYSFPNGVQKEDASMDLIELIGLQTIFQYFVSPNTAEKECGLSYMCKGDKSSEPRCKEHPWTQDVKCPFSMVSLILGLEKKHIKDI